MLKRTALLVRGGTPIPENLKREESAFLKIFRHGRPVLNRPGTLKHFRAGTDEALICECEQDPKCASQDLIMILNTSPFLAMPG